DRLQRERVVAEQGLGALEEGQRALQRLAVVRVGSALAVADDVAVADRQLDDGRVLVGAARDDERLGVVKGERAADDIHGRPPYRTMRRLRSRMRPPRL